MKIVAEESRLTMVDGDRWVGELSFPAVAPGRVVLERTFIRPEYRGQGRGRQLVAAFVDYARQHQLTVKLMCPFAKLEFDRHPAYQDLLLSADRWR